MHNNQYPSDKSLSSIYDLPTPSPPSAATARPTYDVRSPTIPSSPAPAYTALPHRDVDFHITPMLDGKIGDVELETVDGKRFLVHKKVLEAETVFFHIYYGFVPVWRLNAAPSSSSSSTGTNSLPPDITIPIHQSSPPAHPRNSQRISTSFNGFNNLRCLPKIIANTLSRNPISLPPTVPLPAIEELPPPLPPKDIVTAPTPTSSPYTWVVPETSTVLLAFLSLIYPRGVITPRDDPDGLLNSLELTGRVVRASLGYQSSKALTKARDRLSHWVEKLPIETYSMACFFKFNDLIKLSSYHAVKVPFSAWPEDAKVLMGRSAVNRLMELQNYRLEGLDQILARPLVLDNIDDDHHSVTCGNIGNLQDLWQGITGRLRGELKPDMELFELLQLDLGGGGGDLGGCAMCLAVLGRNVQRCLLEARELPRSL
ncbi:hypothetical protein I302_104959 [Kwoniella bestiolae CBS 10118]|uniref:BTB domain-containing protein n=1 Tax=Kwoniella bestiolae CBS 10118 TaxID=1296100 RepID=A0A1B9FR99_9TREE|nr:hypothetical protein I302_08971 [Kwoniella bestiolae CBS 10118]OCF21298.1 hypothetical protein I302_08971 [Kwoniella bestiolae CBS 10118]